MSLPDGGRETRKIILGTAALGAVVTAVILVLMVLRVSTLHVSGQSSLVRGFEHPKGAVEKMLATSDGQTIAAIARDPTLSHPEVFNGHDFAYRAMRPAPEYLTWLLSAGHPGWVPGAMIAVAILSGGAIAAACAALLLRRNTAARLGVLAAVLPGSLSSLRGLVPEAGGVAVAATGWLLAGDGNVWSGVALMSAAGLWRETLLVFPAVLMVSALRRARSLRPAAPYAIPFVVFAGWISFVRSRAGTWPWSSTGGRLGAPFVGIAKDLSYWKNTAALEIAGILVTAALIVLAVRRRDRAAPVMIGYGVLATILGVDVWHTWADWGRVLLPLHLFGLVVLVSARYRVRDTAPAEHI